MPTKTENPLAKPENLNKIQMWHKLNSFYTDRQTETHSLSTRVVECCCCSEHSHMQRCKQANKPSTIIATVS